jgi:pseudouridine-5'-phosphate glycosidase
VRVHPDVAAALDAGRAVVALESTIISHGMPYPANIQTAREVEEVVRNSGAVPAAIAILDGVCCIGLSDDELNRFAVLGAAGKVAKVSRRDLAACVARSGHGGTTVSATMLLADMAGVRVFVTGGIGGVHRGGELSLDISADLCELGRTPVCVVCAGAKSILDIPRTLEFLETQGVAVLALGTDEFPAFFTRRSGCPAPTRVETAHEAAAVVHASSTLGLSSGTLVAVPIPESAEAEAGKVQGAIEQALAEAGAAGVAGRDTTPFLLKRIAELTGGDSLASNIALIKNNAAVGAQIATSLAELQRLEPSLDFAVERFRPNLLIDTGEANGFVEEAWVGGVLRLGESLELRVNDGCPRCVITTLAQGGLPQEIEILRATARHNRVVAGIRLTVERPGPLALGDPVTLLQPG